MFHAQNGQNQKEREQQDTNAEYFQMHKCMLLSVFVLQIPDSFCLVAVVQYHPVIGVLTVFLNVLLLPFLICLLF